MNSKVPKKNDNRKKIPSKAKKQVDNINNVLNDDCLLLIFNLLTVGDKMNIEIVCKRWKSLSNNLWTGVKELDINLDFFYKHLINFKTERQRTLFVISMLKKIGNNLTTLSIDNNSITEAFEYAIDFSQILFELPKHCKNIINLRLLDSDFEHSMTKDKNLESIFINNKNLKSISLKHSYAQGNCFLKLNASNIEEIDLDKCEFSCNNGLYGFLKNCKNLKSFEFKASEDNETDEVILALDSLNMSECEGLLKFSFNWEPICDFDFKLLFNFEFFRRQKKLRQFILKGLYINDRSENFINSLSDSLEILEIQTFENLPKFFWRFSNLVSLKLEIAKDLNDAYIQMLTNFINLKELDLNIKEYLLTPAGESYFSKFENLETFRFRIIYEKNVDNILIALAECKNLMNISIPYVKFTKSGLESISLLPKLESLNVSFTNVRDEDLIDCIKNCLNLKKLEINYCQNISNKFIEAAYDIKKKRNDSCFLEISYAETKIFPQELRNLSPLMQFDL